MGFSRQEYGVDCHFLLQRIFLTQGSNPALLHCRLFIIWATRLLHLVFSRIPSKFCWPTISLSIMSEKYAVCAKSLSLSNSLWPHGLQPTRLLCPSGFSRQEYQSVLPCPLLGDLPNPGGEPRSPTLQADSLSSEPPEKHLKLYTYYRNIGKYIFPFFLLYCCFPGHILLLELKLTIV